jgi:hypothetical protein
MNMYLGIYKSENIGAYVDIKYVAELRATSTTPVFTLGGNVTLTEAMRLFNESATLPGYAYLRQITKHIDKIANVPVRNVKYSKQIICSPKYNLYISYRWEHLLAT